MHKRKIFAVVFSIIFIFICNVYSQKVDLYDSYEYLTTNYHIKNFTQFSDNKPELTLNKLTPDELTKNKIKTDNPLDTGKITYGEYTPNQGFGLLSTDQGTVRFSIFSYVRYMNQIPLDASYTNAFGVTSAIKRRQDVQVNKVVIKFLGWFIDPKFRYFFYAWTNNTAQGQVSQVVIAGNLNYNFSKQFNLGFGIEGLPSTRTTSGTFPNWLSVDNRMIADEYFRASYTTGIWANGYFNDKLTYFAMLGNNMSQLGIDAGQLDNIVNTFSGTISWFPTTGEFGMRSSFGDFENHREVATRLAGHFTFSLEDRQSQPTSDNFDNVQLRLSDGSPIFIPGLFGQEINIEKATYQMSAFDAGVKYKGFALEGEFYYRWLNNFTGPGTDSLKFNTLYDKGFQLMASYMVLPQKLQVYSTFSQVFGGYGNPYDARLGINFYPFKNRMVRWNFQYTYLYKSPVGGLSLPYPVGGTGGVFNTDFMISF